MGDPLILYRAGDLDAEAAKELLLERWPGAGVRPMAPHTVPIWSKHRAQPVWCIGLLGDRPADDLYHPIKPTADACMAMLVWRELHWCRACDGQGRYDDDRTCTICDGLGCVEPPAWLRYLDDAVCGRWDDLPHTKAVWAAAESWGSVAGYHILRAAFLDAREAETLMREGNAIIRARKLWEAERDGLWLGLREALRIGDCVEARHARDWAKLHKIAGMDSSTDPP